MGGRCSRSSTINNVPNSTCSQFNGHSDNGARLVLESHALAATVNNNSGPLCVGEDAKNCPREPFSFPELSVDPGGINASPHGVNLDDIDDGIPRLSRVLSHKSRSTKSKQAAAAKLSEVSTFLGKAVSAGLGKAVEVLDALGSSMTSLHLSGGFVAGVTNKENKISLLTYEVANTIVRVSNLIQSLSKENIRHIKEVVLRSEGVQSLISKDMDELQRIVAADMREEVIVFSQEVVRFGNRCKDPQYHNLDCYFEKLASELTPQMQLKEEADTIMQHLLTLVHHTAELYHELHALDIFDQDHRRRGDSLAILWAELKSPKQNVRSSRKNLLWS